LNSKQIAINALKASEEKKGLEPLILDLRKQTDFVDYFFIVHGTSDRHVQTISEAVEEALRAKNIKPLHVNGVQTGNWVVLDYGSVMVHVFHYETRKYYNLERLWGAAALVSPSTARKKNARPAQIVRRSSPA
jgi:ribosome-associated protein